jgi:hypothetical protein
MVPIARRLTLCFNRLLIHYFDNDFSVFNKSPSVELYDRKFIELSRAKDPKPNILLHIMMIKEIFSLCSCPRVLRGERETDRKKEMKTSLLGLRIDLIKAPE